MPFTRSSAEAILVHRRGPSMLSCTLDGTTHDGTNPDLADPISSALDWLGQPCDDPSDPTDTEVGGLAKSDRSAFLDLAEVRLLDTMVGRFPGVDFNLGPDQWKLAQLRDSLVAQLAVKRADVARLYPEVAAAVALASGS